SGNWNHLTERTRDYANTLSTSSTVGNSASLLFNGSRVVVGFSKQKYYGKLGVSILDKDGVALSGYPVTIDENSSSTVSQVLWNSGILEGQAPFTLVLTHSSGKTVDFDMVAVGDAPGTAEIGETD